MEEIKTPMDKYFKIGGIVIALILVALFIFYRTGQGGKWKSAGRKFIIKSLNEWKSGNKNSLSKVSPAGVDKRLWKDVKLIDFKLLDVSSNVVYRGRYGLTPRSVTVYAKVKLKVEFKNGRREDFEIKYSLRPAGGRWLVSRSRTIF